MGLSYSVLVKLQKWFTCKALPPLDESEQSHSCVSGQRYEALNIPCLFGGVVFTRRTFSYISKEFLVFPNPLKAPNAVFI